MDSPAEEIKAEATKIQKWYKKTYQKDLGFEIEYNIDFQKWDFFFWYDNPRRYFPYCVTAKIAYSDWFVDILKDMVPSATRAIKNEMEMNVNPSGPTVASTEPRET